MSKPVRVRFAPSPTGALHIGGVRTALFNYLFAKKNGGTFFLRIEDTDRTRFVEGAEEYILKSLHWLGISPSETVDTNEKFGPYRQSDRLNIYQKYIDYLINSGHAYYAFDTAAELTELRNSCESEGKTFIYNHHNREVLQTSLRLGANETARLLSKGQEYVIRFKTPINETVTVTDMIRGKVQFETNLLDDKVLYKSDGMPTYHFANIVDDYLMETSHVIRGEEWLPSLPLHLLLYKAFSWEAPQFAHLPLILKPIGNGKLSKRDGDKLGFPVFPLEWRDASSTITSKGYKENGFFPEAVINFLALLGWNDGTEQEIFSIEELTEKFDLSRIHKAGAKFDPEKNKWFNHQYLQKQTDESLAASFAPTLLEKGISIENEKLIKIVSLVKERANFVSDFWELTHYFFEAPKQYEAKALKNWKEETSNLMNNLNTVLQPIADFTAQNIENVVKKWMTENEIGMGKIMQPFRISLVGALKGVQLFDIVEIIGKEETMSRISKAITQL